MRRVRALEPDGTEHLVTELTAEEKALRLARVVFEAHTAEAGPATGAPAGAAAAAGADAAEAAHATAVECVLKARAELEPILDIIAHLETNEHVSIVEVQRPSAKVETLIADLAVRAQSKYAEIQAAAAMLRRAGGAASAAAERSGRFFRELAQLQHTALLLPAPEAAATGAAFVFDVSSPGVRAPPAETHVLVGPSSDTGSVCVVGAAPPAEGVDAVRAVLRARQASHFRAALSRHLREEVGALAADDPSGALAALEAQLQRALSMREAGEALGRSARAWLRQADTLFLAVLRWTAAGGASANAGADAAAAAPRVLPPLLAQLRHAAAARQAHARLATAVEALREGAAGAPGLPATLLQQNTGDALTSAWEVRAPPLPPVSVLLRGTQMHVEGVRTSEPLDPASAGVQAAPEWVAFWVADALCKHALLALRGRAAAAGWETIDGRRHLRMTSAKSTMRISGTATQQGAIAWEVSGADRTPVAVKWPKGGRSALEVLGVLLEKSFK